MCRSVRCVVFLLPVVFAWAVLAQLGVDCPKCNYTFDGPVPPPRVGGVATGSGFVVHPDGYILTNYHVIEGSRSIKVKVAGQEYTASVVDSLPAQDLALLKIDARGLPVAVLGNSDLLQVGDDVFAIGCPGGVCGTVTVGRVANIGVTITVEGGKELRGMLMVDITIDRGSSGGPLVNSRGEVVGVTTAGRQGSFGFAVPINQAIPLLRGVPGFSTGQMGQATTELPFRELRDRMNPVTVFILTDKGAAIRLPPRYEMPAWLRETGGVLYPDYPFPFITCSAVCLLDERVPHGCALLGYVEGYADRQQWRRFLSVTKGDLRLEVTFEQETFASVMQFESSAMAEAAVQELMRCPESVTLGTESCTRLNHADFCPVLTSTSDKYGVLVVKRQLVAHDDLPALVASGLSVRRVTEGALVYATVAVLDSLVIRLVARVSVQCKNCQIYLAPVDVVLRGGSPGWRQGVRAGTEGIYVYEDALRYVVITYDAFVRWATDREKELLDFILAQF